MPEARSERVLARGLEVALVLILLFRAAGGEKAHRFLGDNAFEGDEVTYLRITHSLASDGDSSLSEFVEDELKNRTNEAMNVPTRLDSGHVYGRNGTVAALQLPGLPLLLAPAYALDLAINPPVDSSSPTLSFLPARLSTTFAFLLALLVSAILLLSRLLRRLFQSVPLEVTLVLLLIMLSPVPGYAFQIYPEVPALLFALLALNAIVFPFRSSWVTCLSFVVGVGYLPWLHQRFALLSIGLVLAFFICRGRRMALEKKSIAAMGLALTLIALLYFHYFYSITGNPSPLSISQVHGKVYARVAVLRRGLFGHLLHHGNGMIWVYPWTTLSVMGIYCALKKDTRRAIALLCVFLPYYLIVSMAIPYSGITLPMGRFLVVLFPVFCAFAGYALSDLVKSRQASQLVLYSIVMGFVFLNRSLWLVEFNYTPNLTVYNLRCAIVILILIAVSYVSDRIRRPLTNL